MERVLYERMADSAQTHWWYVARRQILNDLIARKVRPASDARVLEIGCGTGHNFEMLSRFGRVDGIETDDVARRAAETGLGRPVGTSPLPQLTGIADASYDLIAVLDVIEHVDEDVASLCRMAELLRPGGAILITVPALPWLWSAHDEANHHKRRYTKASLRAAVASAGLHTRDIGYFNSLLFPLAAAKRIAGNLLGASGSEDALPPIVINRAFRSAFALERHLVGRVSMPTGVSLFSIVRADK